jgi:NTP pyrophosphatase (non-canonical NTP hydrolase)
MDFDEYQKASRKTALYPNVGDNVPYITLGLAGESGEVAEKVKKLIRDHNFKHVSDISEDQKDELIKELGDILWYIAQMATELGRPLEEVAVKNIEKTHSRLAREKLHGDGDNR